MEYPFLSLPIYVEVFNTKLGQNVAEIQTGHIALRAIDSITPSKDGGADIGLRNGRLLWSPKSATEIIAFICQSITAY